MSEKQKERLLYLGICLFLVCYFMQLWNFQMIWMLGISAVFCCCFLIRQKVLRIDVGLVLLAVTMCSFYVMQYGLRAVATMIPYVPVAMYVLANYLAGEFKGKENWEKKFIGILLCLVIGYTLHGMMNSYLYYAGYVKQGTRQWFDIWTKTYMPGTQHNLFYLPVLAMVFPAMMKFREHKIGSSLIMLCALFFIYTSLVTKSRLSILIFAMIFCGEALLYLILESKRLKEFFCNKKTWMFLGGGVLTAGILGFLLKDLPVIRAFAENLGRGGGILHNVRFQLQAKALGQLFDYPFGGRQMDLFVKYDHQYIHNVWLDMANASGIIPFFAFSAFAVFSIVVLIRFLMRKDFSATLKMITAGLYMTFFLFYWVEPALDASIHYMAPWMLIIGMMHGILTEKVIHLNFLRRGHERDN